MRAKWWHFLVGLGVAIFLVSSVLICVIIVNGAAFIISSSYNDRADLCYDSGEYEEAVKWYERALKLYPKYWWTYYCKAEALVELGKLEEAVEVYDEALARNPDDDFISTVYKDKAEALAELGRYEEAAESYACAIDHTPVWEAVRNPWDTAMDLFNEGSYAEAIAYFETNAKSDPYDYNAYYMIGRAWLALGRYEEAVLYLSAASLLRPDYAPAWEGKAWALGLMGRYEVALECADRALALDARDPDAWNTKGKILLFSAEAAAARECFDRALARYPSSPEALLAKGVTYFAEAKYDEARPCFEELKRAGGSQHYLLYLYLIDRAQGRIRTDRLQPLLEAPPDPWPKNLSLFLIDRISAGDLLTEAADDEVKLCEAHFFIGYENKFDGDAAAARRHFGEAVATGQIDAAEYSLARYELRRSAATGE